MRTAATPTRRWPRRVVLGSVLAGVFALIVIFGDPYPGWTSLAVLILIIGGFIIMSTGVTGLYIGKIYDQVKDRPLYVVAERAEQEAMDSSEGN